MRLCGFFVRRWRGEVALPVLLWRDMIAVGTVINLGAAFLGLVLASQGVALGLAATVYFAPLPYNMFLFAAVWRSPQRTATISVVAALWFVAMTIF